MGTPGAQAPTDCKWGTFGCTDTTALNYNSDATHDDNSCVLPVYGCTLGRSLGVPKSGVTKSDNAYSGIDSGTPNFETLTYGSALRSVGVVFVPDYQAAANFNPSATVIDRST